MLKDASRRRFDVLAFWSIDRLGRSTAQVTAALEELAAAGVTIYADKEGMDGNTPHGKAMLQMAAVFGELERSMIQERVHAGLERARAAGKLLGRPKHGADVEAAVCEALGDGKGILRVAKDLGIGTSVVQRIKAEMKAEQLKLHLIGLSLPPRGSSEPVPVAAHRAGDRQMRIRTRISPGKGRTPPTTSPRRMETSRCAHRINSERDARGY